ncbi:MAG: hypothetical protein WCD37_07340 [Chloroflexia bacterium]
MAQPNLPYSNEQISVIEDLDPEQGGREPGWRLDLLLGVALLLAVVLFAGWQWWRQDYQSNQYRAGQEAAGRNDWESAIQYFGAASGYNDAEARANGAREKIEARDRLYKSAIDHAGKGEWLHTLRDVREVARIQPNYLDIVAREESALENVYTLALSGTVAMRAGANPPGLYYRGADGWVWLDASDQYSHVFALDEEGQIVYDVPGEGWTDGPLSPEGLYSPGTAFKSRALVVGHLLGGEPRFTRLPLELSVFTPIVSGRDGIWAGNFNALISSYRGSSRYSVPIVRDMFFTEDLVYQPYSGAPSASVQIVHSPEITAGATIVAVDPDSNRYLLAEWTNAHEYGAGGDTVVNLYMASAGETTKQLVYTHTGGGLQSAHISPDGRFVVVHTFSVVVEPYQERQTTMLVDLQDVAHPVMFGNTMAPKDGNGNAANGMVSTFLRRGPLVGNLVLASYQKGEPSTRVLVIDPVRSAGGIPHLSAEAAVSGDEIKTWAVVGQDEAGVVIAGQVLNPADPPVTGTLTLIALTARGERSIHEVEVSSYSGVTYARLDENRIVWTEYEYLSNSSMRPPPPREWVYSIPRSEADGRRSQVFTTGEIEDRSGSITGSFYLGEGLLAYTTGRELHARAYDGTVDLVIETGVESVIGNNRNNYYTGGMR